MTKVKGTDFNFSMSNLDWNKREELLEKGEVSLIPIGTECWEVEGFAGWYKKIVVTEKNQRNVTLNWNAMYFLKEEDAYSKLYALKGEYGAWQQRQVDYCKAVDMVDAQLRTEGCPEEYFSIEMDERLAAMGF